MADTSKSIACFDNDEHLMEVIDCRWGFQKPCSLEHCPKGVSRATCEVAFFLGCEGRAPDGALIQIGNRIVGG